jgi:pyruvate/2-oxoglutarate/acetoin dehydrogenase E1 component
MRVVENLNAALRSVLARNDHTYLLGEDIADPYGGAFRVTQGLSTAFPGRVITTPISESGIVGLGAGLALAGATAIVEMMFGDFVALAFDQIVNFASKSTAMYGQHTPLQLIVRCPSGGRRGYGPTHSQNLQKHFIGAPGLSLYEISPFYDNLHLLRDILTASTPALLFEDKVLYTMSMFTDGRADDLFRFDFFDDGTARVFADDLDVFDCVLLITGGIVHRALQAARSLLLDDDVAVLIIAPAKIYPLDLRHLRPLLARARTICIAEEGTAGGTWADTVAQQVHRELGGMRKPIRQIHARNSVIPTARHLEDLVLVQPKTIRDAVLEALRD